MIEYCAVIGPALHSAGQQTAVTEVSIPDPFPLLRNGVWPREIPIDKRINMATSKASGGFDCDFVEPPPKSLECPICLLTVREPHIVVCCGNQFCRPCIDRIRQDGKPCPLCNEPNFTAFVHKGVMREVNALAVRCSQKHLGCQWVGELGQLKQHLNPGQQGRAGCNYVEVECRYQCGGCFRRQFLLEHELESCPKRPVEVLISSTMRKLEASLVENQSLREEISRLKNIQMEQSKKLNVTLAECKSLKASNEKLKNRVYSLEQGMQQTTEAQKASKRQLEVLRQHQTKSLEAVNRDISELKQTQKQQKAAAPLALPPFYFRFYNYQELKRQKIRWFSDPFYSHPQGYKLRIQLDMYISYADSQVLYIFVRVMRGEYDDCLQWPFQGKVTIQMFDRESESWLYEKIFSFRHQLNEINRKPVDVFENVGCGDTYFISCKVLESNARYLRHDAIRFRVARVELD